MRRAVTLTGVPPESPESPDSPPESASARTPETGETGEPAPVRRRNRHGRGRSGPLLRPPRGVRDPRPTRSARFDQIVLGVVSDVDGPWRGALGELEYAVEDLPLLPADWDAPVPLAQLVPAGPGHPRRIVLFRRPLERRSESRTELELLVRNVVAQQLAELLGIAPEDIDPDFDPDL